MAVSIGSQLELLSKQLADLYFVKRDYTSLIGFLSKDITWIGTREKEICESIEDAKKHFAEEQKNDKGYFIIEDSWIKAKEVDDETGIVLANFKLRMSKDYALNMQQKVRFSIIWKKQKGLWKIIHIHNSLPDMLIDKKVFFNEEINKSAYNDMNNQLDKVSNTDRLTGIHNTTGFINDVEKILEMNPNKKYAIIKLGIRDFRYINRMYGYNYGDKVLKNIAKNLARSCHNNETCARIEKDIFALFYEFKSKEAIEKRMNRVRQKIIDKRILNKMKSSINFVTGIYIIDNYRNEAVIDMLDKALLAQKSVSKTSILEQYIYYDDWMLDQQFNCSRLLDEIKPAMDNNEFQLYIQPQYDIRTNELVAGEALCRWIKKEEIILPNNFIPLLEENGIILSFDFYMLEQLCKFMRKWIDAGLNVVPISINQSRLHIGQKNYIKDFCAMVDKYNIPHHLIIFELTESAFVEKQDEMLKLASQLHQLEFQLAIDDFGTGFASLNLLSVVLADILKIDKSLLDDVKNNQRSRSIIQKIIELAHDIDMKVVCEGIETQPQFTYLNEIGCDIGQGYLLSRPISSKEFEEKILSLYA